MAVPTFTASGAKASVAATLPKEIFAVEVANHELLKQAYVGYLANGRSVNAHVKKRGEVSGGGKKPWRQKGTGRARFGSTRNPIWRHGGVAFGPTGEENFSHNLPVAAKRQALRQALSLKNKDGKVLVAEKLNFKKTADAAKFFKKIGVERSVLVVVPAFDAELDKSVRNISSVSVVTTSGVTAFHVLNADSVVLIKESVKALADRFGGAK